MGSTFMERFSVVGTAVVLGLMGMMGVYGLASLFGVEPDSSLIRLPPRPEEEVSVSDGPGDGPAPDELLRSESSPAAQPGDTPPASPTPGATPQPSGAPPVPVLSLARDEARPVGVAGTPAVTAAPASSPPGVANTPAPGPPPETPPPSTPAPETPAPTPPPVGCSPGAPELTENGNQLRFSNGTVVLFEGGSPGFLLLDVGGTAVPLLITQFTEVLGDLGAATVVSGQGHRANDGTIVAQALEVVCP